MEVLQKRILLLLKMIKLLKMQILLYLMLMVINMQISILPAVVMAYLKQDDPLFKTGFI